MTAIQRDRTPKRLGTGPTLADAERAAATLAAAGVGRVVLFGSVAGGEAHGRSDIDLLAIYDDLDYSQRWQRRCDLAEAAATAAGYPVDVVVTDWPEWRVRTERVCTSLEARVARSGVVLADRPVGEVDWHKEMVMPVSDYEEALYRLRVASNALSALRGHLEPHAAERAERQAGNQLRAFAEYGVRLLRIGGDAHGVVEGSVKALIHLTASPRSRPWGHDIARLCRELDTPHDSNVEGMFEPYGAEAISEWSGRAGYEAGSRGPGGDPVVAVDLARIACAVASYTASRFNESVDEVKTIRWRIHNVESHLDSGQLIRRWTPTHNSPVAGRLHGDLLQTPVP